MEHIEETSERRGDGYVNLALLTDGLRAEREQGITIDVAYRVVRDPKRRFQLADAPGHVQYTRNMVTGASTADVAVVLLDARKGVIEQTRRHTLIASLLGVPHLVFAVNKMDLVDFDEARFREIDAELRRADGRTRRQGRGRDPDRGAPRRQRRRPLRADALVDGRDAPRASRVDRDRGRPQPRRSPLPRAVGDPADVRRAPRLPRVCRARSPAASGGRETTSSCCRPGCARGSPRSTRRTARSSEATPGMSVTIRLEDEIDVPRGDMLVDPDDQPVTARALEATVCWMSERPLQAGARLGVKHTTRTVARGRRGDRRGRRHGHARAARRDRDGAERHRHGVASGSRRRSMVDPYADKPCDGRVHPDRRGDERHGRRRHGARSLDLGARARPGLIAATRSGAAARRWPVVPPRNPPTPSCGRPPCTS